MATTPFDRALHELTMSPSRRHLLGGMLGALVGGVLGSASSVSAKGKKGKGGKGKKKKRRGGPTAPPAGPAAVPDATCTATGGGYGAVRVAQTFRARRSGQLTSASVGIRLYKGDAIDMEIWSVNSSNVPLAVLAGTTIAVAKQTQPVQTVTGTFPAPAPVVAGLRYALVITAQPGRDVSLDGFPGNPCLDGGAFAVGIGGAAWVADPDWDLHFTTVVTA